MADREWVSAHLFHSGDLDRLLTEAVHPLVGELVHSGLVRDWFFLRYWEGGPHLRLRLLPATHGARDAVRDVVAERCGWHLRRYPSTRAPDPVRYRELAARLARVEGLASHTATLYPDNSVQFLEYRPENDRYGTGACLHAVERHFADSSGIALALVSAGTGPAGRSTAAFCAAMLAHLLCPAPVPGPAGPPVPGPAGPPAGPAVPDAYPAQRERLLGLGAAMRRIAAGERSAGGLALWRDSLVALRAALAPYRAEVDPPAVADACVHLFCNRLGVTLPEEAHLRYLVARTLADPPGEE